MKTQLSKMGDRKSPGLDSSFKGAGKKQAGGKNNKGGGKSPDLSATLTKRTRQMTMRPKMGAKNVED